MALVDQALLAECEQELEKPASVALVRRMAQGLLSPATIQRAASIMPAGSVRSVGTFGNVTRASGPSATLGHGMLNLADRVVGNLGGGQAGEFVRKLPLRTLPTSSANMQAHYQPLVDMSRAVEQRYGGNVIAPYVQATNRGGFQVLDRPGIAPRPSISGNQAYRMGIDDVRSDNLGPSGRIIDWSSGPFNTPKVFGHGFGGAASTGVSSSPPLVVPTEPEGSFFRNIITRPYEPSEMNQIRRHWFGNRPVSATPSTPPVTTSSWQPSQPYHPVSLTAMGTHPVPMESWSDKFWSNFNGLGASTPQVPLPGVPAATTPLPSTVGSNLPRTPVVPYQAPAPRPTRLWPWATAAGLGTGATGLAGYLSNRRQQMQPQP
jgi:hypothetical protein